MTSECGPVLHPLSYTLLIFKWAIGQSEILPLFILINSDPFTNLPEIIVGFLRGGGVQGEGVTWEP